MITFATSRLEPFSCWRILMYHCEALHCNCADVRLYCVVLCCSNVVLSKLRWRCCVLLVAFEWCVCDIALSYVCCVMLECVLLYYAIVLCCVVLRWVGIRRIYFTNNSDLTQPIPFCCGVLKMSSMNQTNQSLNQRSSIQYRCIVYVILCCIWFVVLCYFVLSCVMMCSCVLCNLCVVCCVCVCVCVCVCCAVLCCAASEIFGVVLDLIALCSGLVVCNWLGLRFASLC